MKLQLPFRFHAPILGQRLSLAAFLVGSSLLTLLAILSGPAVYADLEDPGIYQRPILVVEPRPGDSDYAASVAWGDLDGDGDLDLAVGNDGGQTKVYRNQDGILQEAPAWTAPDIDNTKSVAWGDMDGDGDLDLAIGNWGHNKVYLNQDGILQQAPGWVARNWDNTWSVAWGDMDGDGDLDLAVGNEGPETGGRTECGHNKVYQNQDGLLKQTADWQSDDCDWTQSVAWGDMDRDGDLDLAVGTWHYSKVYRNQDGVLQQTEPWTVDFPDHTWSVAWGDMDGDGYLDLAVSSRGWHDGTQERTCGHNKVYKYRDGVLQKPAAWTAVDCSQTRSITWGDIDSDGDLDLAVGNYFTETEFSNTNKVYRNQDGVLQQTYVWEDKESHDYTRSMAWGDMDGDGDLDLTIGNAGRNNKIYRNQGVVLQLTSASPAFADNVAQTRSVAWGDMDSDGDLDLAVSNSSADLGNFESSGRYLARTRVYLNQDGKLKRVGGLLASDSSDTSSVAWGDMDRDGYLDLAVGNLDQPNKVYRYQNQDGMPQLTLSWSGPVTDSDRTWSVAWGDMDDDGDLDLAVGVDGGYDPKHREDICGYNKVYQNQNGILQQVATWKARDCDRTRSVAWGDVDGDGDLDLAVGNFHGRNKVYRNQDRVLQQAPSWTADDSDYTSSVAWGDVDGDGDLDLAVGNLDQPNKVYLNQDGVLQQKATWRSVEVENTTSVAWGDVDGDGDLDLAVGNTGGDNKVYLNQDGLLQRTAAWRAVDAPAQTRSLAFGDVDGDGDLDLAVGNLDQSNKVYLNTRPVHPLAAGEAPEAIAVSTTYYALPMIRSGVIPITYTLYHPLSETMRAVKAMFSLDGGGHWQEARPITGTKTSDLATLPYPQSAATNTHVFNWDVNASGFFGQSDNVVVRLVAYPGLKPRKNGIPGPFQRPFVSTQTYPFRVRGNQVKVITDTVTVGNTDAVVYRLPAGKERGAEPLGGIEEPFRTSANGFLQGRAEMIVETDEKKSDRLVALWPSALVTQSVPTRSYISQDTFPITLTATPPVRSQLFVSDTRSIGDIELWVAISPTLPVEAKINLIAPRHGPTDIVIEKILPPAQSTVVFESADQDAVARCPEHSDVCRVAVGALSALHGTLADGTWTLEIANPTTKPVQLLGWGLNLQLSPLHFTSAKPIATGLESDPVRAGGVQTLTVSSKNPLLLFDLNIALEWNASNDEQYMAQLSADLRRASELLYDWSNGQVALGNVRVYHDARRNSLPDGTNAWNSAHIRIYASNRLRPNADQGGIISEAVSETVTISNTTKEITYLPGQVRIGSVWNRYGDSTTGNLGDDWPAALAHELGHYLLFLDDNYLGLNQNNLIVPLADDVCPGAMNNPYSNVYSEFHPAQDWAKPGCAKTLSDQNTRRSDWQTISRFYPWLISPAESFKKVMQGPNLLPLAVTQVTMQAPDPASDPMTWLTQLYGQSGEAPKSVYRRLCVPQGSAPSSRDQANPNSPVFECPAETITSTQPLEVPIFYLKGMHQGDMIGGQARAFLFQGLPYPTLVDLGQPTGDQVVARGARLNDRLCVYDLANGRVGCEAITPGDDQLEMQQPEGWQPQIIVSPETSRTLQVSVTLPDITANSNLTLTARLYPMDGPAPARITMTHAGCMEGSCVYSVTFTSDAPVLEGYVLVGKDEGQGLGTNPRQVVTEFAIGGNPVRIKALLAPTDRREVRVKWLAAPQRAQRVRIRALLAPAASPDGQVLVYPDENVLKTDREWSFTLQPATRLPAELPWATPVGRAYWLATSATITDVGKSSITFEYRASDVPPGEEPFVRIYYWDPQCQNQGPSCWRKLDSQPDLASNLISAPLQGQTGAGLYALMTSIELPLRPGWNLIGYPVQTASVLAADRQITEVLRSINGAYSVIYGYDATDARDPWKLYAPRPDVQSDLAALDFGRGYWLCITATQPITLHLLGSLPGVDGEKPAPAAVSPVGMPVGRQPITFHGHLTATASFVPKAGMTVLARVDGADCGQGQTYADGQGIAYQITMGGNDRDGVNRCGQGSKFVFYADGREMVANLALSECGIEAVDLAPAGAR